jgi:hypothetical protein
MASVATVTTALKAKLVSDTSVTAIILNSLWRRYPVPVGTTYASVNSAQAGEAPDSNVTYILGNFVIEVVHRLPLGAWDEDAYLDGAMRTDQALLMAKSFYRTIAGVYDVEAGPEPDTVGRNGNCIEYTVTVQLAITP